jgi:hypothetical protein
MAVRVLGADWSGTTGRRRQARGSPFPVDLQILRFEVLPVVRRKPLPEDVAERMGMAPYVAETSQERFAS